MTSGRWLPLMGLRKNVSVVQNKIGYQRSYMGLYTQCNTGFYNRKVYMKKLSEWELLSSPFICCHLSHLLARQRCKMWQTLQAQWGVEICAAALIKHLIVKPNKPTWMGEHTKWFMDNTNQQAESQMLEQHSSAPGDMFSLLLNPAASNLASMWCSKALSLHFTGCADCVNRTEQWIRHKSSSYHSKGQNVLGSWQF